MNKNQIKTSLDYHHLINYMKELKFFFHKEYDYEYTLGKINQASQEYTYFSLTPEDLKKQKLKFVIVLDHALKCFTICLSGQNKNVRKKYWEIFKGSDWDKYHLTESINSSLMILSHKVAENADFSDKNKLTSKIEKESIHFMNDLREILK